MEGPQRGRLDPAEGELQGIVDPARPPPEGHRCRQRDGAWIPGASEPVDLRPARIPQSHGARDLVKGLARGIVACPAQGAVLRMVGHGDEIGVRSRDDQSQGGKCQVRLSEKCRVDVPFEVVHAHQGQIQAEGERFRRGHADGQRSHQSRPAGHREGVEVAQCHAGLLQGFVDHREQTFDVFARCQFGHHATKPAMEIGLRGDDAALDDPAVSDHRGRGLVTGGFDTEDAHKANA